MAQMTLTISPDEIEAIIKQHFQRQGVILGKVNFSLKESGDMRETYKVFGGASASIQFQNGARQ